MLVNTYVQVYECTFVFEVGLNPVRTVAANKPSCSCTMTSVCLWVCVDTVFSNTDTTAFPSYTLFYRFLAYTVCLLSVCSSIRSTIANRFAAMPETID